LLLFLEKEDNHSTNSTDWGIFWGPAPKPPWFRFAEGLGDPQSSAQQNKRFLLLFLEKEENY
jgi:hypothetical protein